MRNLICDDNYSMWVTMLWYSSQSLICISDPFLRQLANIKTSYEIHSYIDYPLDGSSCRNVFSPFFLFFMFSISLRFYRLHLFYPASSTVTDDVINWVTHIVFNTL